MAHDKDQKAHEKDRNADVAATTPIVGVCVRYCDGTTPTDVWLDMDKVSGLCWGDVDAHKPPKVFPPGRPPKAAKGEPLCTTTAIVVSDGICWFDSKSNSWICGD